MLQRAGNGGKGSGKELRSSRSGFPAVYMVHIFSVENAEHELPVAKAVTITNMDALDNLLLCPKKTC